VVRVRMAVRQACRGGRIGSHPACGRVPHNISVDTPLARTGACARIYLPSGWICALPTAITEAASFLHPEDIADAEKGRSSMPGPAPGGSGHKSTADRSAYAAYTCQR
jgi:hypothetical protein